MCAFLFLFGIFFLLMYRNLGLDSFKLIIRKSFIPSLFFCVHISRCHKTIEPFLQKTCLPEFAVKPKVRFSCDEALFR